MCFQFSQFRCIDQFTFTLRIILQKYYPIQIGKSITLHYYYVNLLILYTKIIFYKFIHHHLWWKLHHFRRHNIHFHLNDWPHDEDLRHFLFVPKILECVIFLLNKTFLCNYMKLTSKIGNNGFIALSLPIISDSLGFRRFSHVMMAKAFLWIGVFVSQVFSSTLSMYVVVELGIGSKRAS